MKRMGDERFPASNMPQGRVGGWEWDVAARTMIWSEDLFRLHGLDPGFLPHGSQEHIDRSLECYDEFDRPIVLAAFQRCCETGESFDLQVPFTPFKGRKIWIRATGCAVRADGRVVKVIGNVIDITSQRQLDETLQHNEKSFRMLAQYAPVPIAFHDETGRIEFLNTRFTETFGYTVEDIPNVKDWWAVACPNEVYRRQAITSWKRAVDQAIREKRDIRQTEFLIRRKDGTIRRTEIFGSQIGSKFLILLHDVTESRAASEAAKNDEARVVSLLRLSQRKTGSLKELLDLALDEALVLTSSPVGFISFYDEATQVFVIHAWSKTVMQQCAIPSPPTTFLLQNAGLWGEPVRRRGPIVINDFQAPNPMKRGYPQGHTHISRFLTVPIFSDDRIVAVVAVGNKDAPYGDQDIRQLELMTDEVWKMVVRKQSEETLERSLEEQTALLKEVHHRVKNNLQIVNSLLNLQASRLNDPDVLQILTTTQNRVRSMALLHETLYRSGNLARIDLPEYLESLCAHLLRAIGPDPQDAAPNIGSGAESPSAVPRLQLERRIAPITLPLDQAVPCGLIINELISNALKHAFPRKRAGRIILEAELDKDANICVTIADNGVGLPATFDPGTASTLGLQLVTMLVEQLQGSFEIARDEGTRFRIRFPLGATEQRKRR